MAQLLRTSTGISTVKGTSSTTFTWIINNFSKSNPKRLFSDVFPAACYEWQLVVYPEGIIMGEGLSLFLRLSSGSAKLPSGWTVNVEFSLTLINQIRRNDSITKRTDNQFCDGKTDCGCPYFMPLTELFDPSKGFLANDTVIIEAHVSVIDSSSGDSKEEIHVAKSWVPLMRKKMMVPAPLPDTSNPVSLTSCSLSGQSSSPIEKSKNLLKKVSSLKITQKSISARYRGISESSLLSISPEALQEKRKALKDYLELSLEAIDQANAFDEIERIAFLLVHHSASSLERAILKYLVSLSEAFKEIVPATKSTIENVRARMVYLSRKKENIRARLCLGQEKLNSLQVKFSKILEEEERELERWVMLLATQKDEFFIKKKLIAIESEKMNEQVSKDLEEWNDIVEEDEVAAKDWIQAREKLAQANLNWQLFKQNLELCEKSV